MGEDVESALGIPPESTGSPGPIVPGTITATTTSVWSFEGRIGRATFWGIQLSMFAIGFGVGIVIALMRVLGGEGGAVLGLLLDIAWLVVAVWIGLATQVKRWHDMDYSGLTVLWNLTIIAIPVTFIFVGFIRGTNGPNKYGADPLTLVGGQSVTLS